MSERDDQSIDHELSGIAMAATHEHEQTVSTAETDAALDAVRSRVVGGDLGGVPPSIDLTRERRRRSPLVLLGAAAAVIGMIGLGLVAVVGGNRTNDVIIGPQTIPATAPAPSTIVGTTTDPAPGSTPPRPTTTTTTTTTVTGEGLVRQTISVDAADPPPVLQPVPYFTLPLAPNPDGQLLNFAVGADHVVVNQPGTGTITIVGPDGAGFSAREVPVDEGIGPVASGPGPIVYGYGELAFDEGESVPRGLRLVAIPFLGENEGEVVAVEEVGLALEVPPYWLGHGPDGIISRGQVPMTEMAYVDEQGQPRDSGERDENGTPYPVFEFGPDEEDPRRLDPDIVTLPGTDLSWELDIVRDPEWAGFPFVGRSVVAPGAQRGIYTERIGADTRPDSDFGPNEMPVVALLNYDGTGEWIRLPDDWDVVASDVWGTLLARITDDTIELASLEDLVPPTGPAAPIRPDRDPVATATTTTVPSISATQPSAGGALTQPTAITRTCVSEFDCTQLVATEAGRIVAFDPGGDTLRVYDPSGTELESEVTITEPLEADTPRLEHVGPDDVAYVRIVTPGASDPSNDLLAIPLAGDRAGSIVMRWTGLDGTGDSSLIPRKSGLTNVPCCGGEGTRPSPDATIYRWVDRNGEVIESAAPSFDLNLGSAGNSLTRIDTAADGSPTFTNFTLPAAYAFPRDFPQVVATDDGGALAYDFVQLQTGGYEVLVDFDTDWPGASVDNADVYYRDLADSFLGPLLESSGTVIVADGDAFVRRNLGEIATPGWPGALEVDLDAASATAPGLDDLIASDQPSWAQHPDLFALQLSPAIGDSEQQRIEFDESDAPVITITTTGLLDDSVEATQLLVITERADDGLLRFVSASYGFRCAEGRGHQDFSTEPCI